MELFSVIAPSRWEFLYDQRTCWTRSELYGKRIIALKIPLCGRARLRTLTLGHNSIAPRVRNLVVNALITHYQAEKLKQETTSVV
jgi:hypothetical protein